MDTYSVKEIADMLNTNPETVRRWIRSGKLEAIQESNLLPYYEKLDENLVSQVLEEFKEVLNDI